MQHIASPKVVFRARSCRPPTLDHLLMAPPSFAPADSRPGRVRYPRASPRQVAQALLYLQQELRPHFPRLAGPTWVRALDRLQPDLWLEAGGVGLDCADLTRLAQYLAAAVQTPGLDIPLHGPRAHCLAQRLVNYAQQAVYALAELEAAPLAYGRRVYELVTGLALGNAVAEEVLHATTWDLPRRPQRKFRERTAPGGALVRQRLMALARARGSLPWRNLRPPPGG